MDPHQRTPARHHPEAAPGDSAEAGSGGAGAAQHCARHRAGRAHPQVGGPGGRDGSLPFGPRGEQAGGLPGGDPSRAEGRRRSEVDGGGDRASLARDGLRLHRIPERHPGRCEGRPGGRRAFSREAGFAGGHGVRGGGQLLLELRHVLLARGRAAGRIAASLAEDCRYPGGAAGFRRAQFRGETQTGLSAVRQHLDRLCRAGEGGHCVRHSGRRFRLERCGKLERGLRTAAARRVGQCDGPRCRVPGVAQ